jgi:hypothetical protein
MPQTTPRGDRNLRKDQRVLAQIFRWVKSADRDGRLDRQIGSFRNLESYKKSIA